MDIPVNAEVYCKDGLCGHSTYVIVNPYLQKHRDGLDRVAKDLLEKEEITGKEVLELVGVETKQASVNKSASV